MSTVTPEEGERAAEVRWCRCGHTEGSHRNTFNTNWCEGDSNPYGRDCHCRRFVWNPTDDGRIS